MAKGSAPRRETMSERIDFLLKHSKGTMPMVILVKTEAEAQEANQILKRKKITNLSVRIDT